MNIERLDILIDILENVKANNLPFDMAVWLNRSDEQPCRTAACAAGHAALDPRLRAQGLQLVAKVGMHPVRHVKLESADAYLYYWRIMGIPPLVAPVYLDQTEYHALATFFEIDMDDALDLFEPGRYEMNLMNDPQEVIDRIRMLKSRDF